jgi:hypothetical protein
LLHEIFSPEVDEILFETELRVFATARALPAYRRLLAHDDAPDELFRAWPFALQALAWRADLVAGRRMFDFDAGRLEHLEHLAPAPDSFFDDLAMLRRARQLGRVARRASRAILDVFGWDATVDGADRTLAAVDQRGRDCA